MSFRKGIVVATHPEDNSVDLVMADDGARLVGVQVLADSASSRTGTVDLPAVAPRASKWDVSQETDQEIIAIVGYVGRSPFVAGFLFPQINQVLVRDPLRRVMRHQSDVQYSIDGEGNVQLVHPSGTYIRIGESPDLEATDGQNADGNARVDRNTGRRVHVRIGTAGGTCVLTIAPGGAVTLESAETVTVTSQGATTIKAASITLDAPSTTATGALIVEGMLTYKGGMKGQGGGGTAASIEGNVSVQGSIDASGSIMDGGGNSNHHSH